MQNMKFLFLLGLIAQLARAKVDYYYHVCNSMIMDNEAYQFLANEEESTQYDNFCKNELYARSVADCIVSASMLTDNAGDITHTWKVSWGYYDFLCDYYNNKNAFTFDSMYEENARSPITETYTEAASSHNQLFKVPDDMLEPNIAQSLDLWESRAYSEQFGQGLLYYVFGIMVIQIGVNFFTWIYPSVVRLVSCTGFSRMLRSYLSVAPLLDNRFSRYLDFYGPRLQFVYIIGFAILSLVFLVVNYDLNSGFYFETRSAMLGNFIAYRAGYLCMYQLPLVFLFAQRNNFLIWLTGWNLDTFNLWHRWVARFATLDAIIHAAAYTVHVSAENQLQENWTQSYWIWGFIGTMSMAILCFQAMRYIRRLSYEAFLVVHVVFVILLLIALYFHLWYTDQCKQEWATVIALWGFDRVFRVVRICLNGRICAAEARCVESDVATLDISYSGLWAPASGSYIFVHWWSPKYFWQSHPFTVVPTKVPGKLRVIVCPRQGLTHRLFEHIKQSDGKEVALKVLVDGPYGVSLNFDPFDLVQFVAGGIGITGVYSHILSVCRGRLDGSTTTVRLDWTVRDRKVVSYFRREILELARLGVVITIHVTGYFDAPEGDVEDKIQDMELRDAQDELLDGPSCDNLVPRDIQFSPGRPSAFELIAGAIDESTRSVCFFCCGPEPLNRDLRDAAALLVNTPGKYVQFYDESFTM